MKFKKGDIVNWKLGEGDYEIVGTKEDPYKATGVPWQRRKADDSLTDDEKAVWHPNEGTDYLIVRSDSNKKEAFQHAMEGHLTLKNG